MVGPWGGAVGELEGPEELLRAVHELRRRGYRKLDAFSPHPVHGLEEALGLKRSILNWMIFPIGIGGAAAAFFIQWYCNAYSYPINVGGRPPFSIPAFIPITFEAGILATGLAAFFLFFWVCRMPSLSHPIFTVDGFERVTIDRFWVGVSGEDPRFDAERTPKELAQVGAQRVSLVPEVSP